MKKNFLITGGTSGIGLDVLKRNINKNYNFFIFGRNFNEINKIFKSKKNIKKIKLDFTKNLNNYNYKKLPEFDYIVFSAGITKFNLTKEFDNKVFDDILNINLLNTSRFFANLIKFKKIRKKGSVVIVSSLAGMGGLIVPGQYSYSISKNGLLGMLKVSALELSRNLIRVNSVAPGMVETSLTKNYTAKYFYEADKKNYPLGQRYCEVNEVSNVINFLLSKKSSFITGQIIAIDGGYSLRK